MNISEIDLQEFYHSGYAVSRTESLFSLKGIKDLVSYLLPLEKDDLFMFVFGCYLAEEENIPVEHENVLSTWEVFLNEFQSIKVSATHYSIENSLVTFYNLDETVAVFGRFSFFRKV